MEDKVIVRLQANREGVYTAIAEVTISDEGTDFVFVGTGYSDDMRKAIDDAVGEAWSIVGAYREEP